MSESNIPVTSGSGNNVDTFTLNTTGNKRQSVVIGDSAIDANVAPIQSTDPSSNSQGLVVRDVNTSAIVSKLTSGVTVTPSGTITVKFDPGYTLGSIQNINSSVAVYFDRAKPIVLSDVGSTSSIFSVSGSSSAVSVSGATIISPSANYNFKIFAVNITTTAQSMLTVKLTNGAGTSPTEYWRYAMQAPTQGIAGANIAVTPPGHFFSTGNSTTLALVLDAASLVHYSISYIKESS